MRRCPAAPVLPRACLGRRRCASLRSLVQLSAGCAPASNSRALTIAGGLLPVVRVQALRRWEIVRGNVRSREWRLRRASVAARFPRARCGMDRKSAARASRVEIQQTRRAGFSGSERAARQLACPVKFRTRGGDLRELEVRFEIQKKAGSPFLRQGKPEGGRY